ncbi:MAG: DUF2927 domain-containing protein [Pseudomonadota bacterium]
MAIRSLRGFYGMTAVLACCVMAVVLAPQRAQAFEDRALIGGFLVTVFGTETDGEEPGTASSVVKKFTGPVRYHLISTSSVDRRSTVRRFMGQLAQTVQNLTLTEAARPEDAEIVVYLVDRADYVPTIRATVWDGVDTNFLESNACSAVLAARRTGIERAFIYLVADEGFVGLAHCMVEEIAQSLGPANDSSLLADSIFNDESRLNVFGIFDWYILNMLYDPRIRPGMTMDEARPLLPEIISDVRRRLPHALEKSRSLAQHAVR